jgi:membrane associated rhomboid family serine protease
VTYSLIAINTLVLICEFADPGIVDTLGFIPASPSPITWFVSLFFHADILHLAGNMLFLWLFGTVAEDVLGPLLFLAFYFGGGVAASLLDWVMSAAFGPGGLDVPRIGASGAIAGIIGLSAVCFMRTRVRVFYLFAYFLLWRTGIWEAPIALFGGLWVFWEIYQGLVSTSLAAAMGSAGGGIAHWAHVGGFAAGVVGALMLGLRAKVARADLISGTASVEDTSGFFSQAGELERLVNQSPTDADSWYALGQAQEMSGRLPRAAEAYGKALQLFLAQRQLPRAAEAYAAMKEYAKPASLPPEVLFDLACALEETGHEFEAYDIFRLAAVSQRGTALAETSLIRAGELARNKLAEPMKAAEAFRALLADYPFSTWAGLAREGLRALRLPERTPPPFTPGPRQDPDLHGLDQKGE